MKCFIIEYNNYYNFIEEISYYIILFIWKVPNYLYTSYVSLELFLKFITISRTCIFKTTVIIFSTCYVFSNKEMLVTDEIAMVTFNSFKSMKASFSDTQ